MGTTVAPWKQLLFGAIEANSHLSHSSSYVQLVCVFFHVHVHKQRCCSFVDVACLCLQATIGLNGRPSNRTVVFRWHESAIVRIFVFWLAWVVTFLLVVYLGRGFEENSDTIRINTDLRSRKVLRIFQITLKLKLLPGFGSLWCSVNFCILLQIEELKHCPYSEVSNLLTMPIWITFPNYTLISTYGDWWLFLEICWYFSDSWEQFRISGSIEVIDASNPDQAKLQVWNTQL